jgi:hypothetical protein
MRCHVDCSRSNCSFTGLSVNLCQTDSVMVDRQLSVKCLLGLSPSFLSVKSAVRHLDIGQQSPHHFFMRWHMFLIPNTVLIEQHALKNINNCINTNIYSYLETSGGQSPNP